MNDKSKSSKTITTSGGVLDEFLNPTPSQATLSNDTPSPYDLAEEISGGGGTSGGECYLEYGTELRMLDLRQVNGSFTALPYHYLETVDFLPSEGIVLTYPMCKVRITGYRLHAIYRALTGFRVGYIQALGNHFMPPRLDDEDGEPAVEGIAIEWSEGR